MLTRYLYGSFLLYFVLVAFYHFATQKQAYVQINRTEAYVDKLVKSLESIEKDKQIKLYDGITLSQDKREKEFLKDADTLFAILSFATLIVFLVIFAILRKYTKIATKKEASLRKANKLLSKQIIEIDRKDKMLIKQSKLAAIGEMITIIAHQWKQPLNSLSLTISDLEDAFEHNEINERYVKNFQENALKRVRYMSRTIDDFRDFFKPNKNRQKFMVKKSIEEVLEILSATLRSSRVNVEIEGDDTLAINTVKGEFEQVVLNIINNAKDALNEKNIRDKKIVVIFERSSEGAIVKIKDNAGGIPENFIEKIFDSYFTTKGDEGTGIGLYMSRMIIKDSLGGELSVENDSEGAVFTIRIPFG